MSETEWTAIPLLTGRVTSKKLASVHGESETAVIRWKDKYRIIKVVDRLPSVSLLWIFGCESPVVLMSRVGNDVLVNYKGLNLSVKTWVLRSEKTIPPSGPRACRCLSADPLASSWSLRKPSGTRCVVLRKRVGRCVYYRGVYWQSPLTPGGCVLIQGVDIRWEVVSLGPGGDMCVVKHGNVDLRVHRSCLIKL
jgi:hypothetical protein